MQHNFWLERYYSTWVYFNTQENFTSMTNQNRGGRRAFRMQELEQASVNPSIKHNMTALVKLLPHTFIMVVNLAIPNPGRLQTALLIVKKAAITLTGIPFYEYNGDTV